MHDDYKRLDLSQIVSAPPNPVTLEPCPICGSAGQLWQYSESETSPRKLLVMCSHGDRIGPQDGLTNEGCPFYMPGDGHYRETIRDAVRYWNELAKAINSLRRKNGWARARVLRADESGVQPSQAPSISAEQLERLARHGCGGDDTRWSFSDAGLRRTIEAALRTHGVGKDALLRQAREFAEEVHAGEWAGSPTRRDALIAAITAELEKQ